MPQQWKDHQSAEHVGQKKKQRKSVAKQPNGKLGKVTKPEVYQLTVCLALQLKNDREKMGDFSSSLSPLFPNLFETLSSKGQAQSGEVIRVIRSHRG